jgi:NAD(P)-dependent dehydrogenase (short-subunit alcohol dehydrogenase family)
MADSTFWSTAGILARVAAEDEPVETFRSVMEIDVVAPWHLSKLAFPHMCAAGGGSIINIASMLGLVGSAPIKQANYCASKGAVINLTRELAAQWGRRGIRVNALCPGFFPSEMTAGLGEDESSRTFIRANMPIPRLGLEHELDGALLLLASPDNTFMTGHSLVVDGGWTAR